MAIRQADVISRLQSGETLIHVIEREDDKHKPYQYLSGGGASNSSHLRQAHRPEKSNGHAGQFRPVPRCRTAGVGLG